LEVRNLEDTYDEHTIEHKSWDRYYVRENAGRSHDWSISWIQDFM